MYGPVSAFLLLLAWVGLALEVDPVPTWFYVFAWYPTLGFLDAVSAPATGGPLLHRRRSLLVSMLLWSPVIWLVFEAANFRLQNWYYVLLPRHGPERWSGIVLSFATVVPALVLMERSLKRWGLWTQVRGLEITSVEKYLNASLLLGIGTGLLSLTIPKVFFPLIWGASLLITEPLVYRRLPGASLYRDLEEGRWGRVGRLMLGGLMIGLIWETYNYWAHGKWIYTVPWLEDLKLFEMPPFGFLGFPIFALEAWSLYHALCSLGVAVPVTEPASIQRRRLLAAAPAALAFSVVVLVGMERLTISSVAPRLEDLPGVNRTLARELRSSGLETVSDLAASSPERLESVGVPAATALHHIAKVATTRGIGARHALRLRDLGILDVCHLADEDPEQLHRSLTLNRPGSRPSAAEVRVWVRAAKSRCASGGT